MPVPGNSTIHPAHAPAGLDSPIARQTLSKVQKRLIPIIVLLYLIAYLDRNNVGFAHDGVSQTLGLSESAFGFGAGVFFLGYVLAEIPSNGGMHRFGAGKWIARILISWGIMATLMAFVWGERSFFTVRFLLGAAEGGFFPGILYYFTLWFPNKARVSALGFFIMAQPFANALGAPVSSLILMLDGTLGFHGWQWLFFLEGIPAILLGILAPRLLTDRPADAKWLSSDEKSWLVGWMAREDEGKNEHRASFLAGLKDRRAWVYGLLNFGGVCGIYGFGMWLPTIMKALVHTQGLLWGLVVMVPYAVALPFVYYVSRRVAVTGKRARTASVFLLVAAAGLLGAAYVFTISPLLAMVFLCIASIGIYASNPAFLSIPSALFTGAVAAASLGLMNALGNLGGFVAPYLVGLIKQATNSNQVALTFLAGLLIVTAVSLYAFAHRRPEGDEDLMPHQDGAAPRHNQESIGK